jgi:catechol 2,3-dioxygenase
LLDGVVLDNFQQDGTGGGPMSLSALQASAYLHHLHIESADPAGLAAFYGGVLDMSSERELGGVHFVRGPGRRLMISSGESGRFPHAGFALRDEEGFEGLRRRAVENHVSTRAFDVPYFKPGAFAVSDPDGNTIVFGLAIEEPSFEGRPLHAPIQHLTLASRNIEAIEAFYAGKLGFGVSDRVLSDGGKLMTSFMRSNHEHHNLGCFYQDRTGVDHHSYEAGEWDRIRDWCDHFASRGISLMWGPGRHGPGNNLFVFIKDPDGNWIEISAELEVMHDRPVKNWRHEERTLNLWGKAILRAGAPDA